ncbi:hypothetical protein OPT61_g8425 [Boeremia exigua]|uniref:Uncharacterized protein n=1 Tax=Boeremia exigua TaxID=749465 RepID=A0ACC2HZE7_9PLEO|nr:hypothetical protein OPT61_g8425 [Boeremia exigua]
MAKQYSIASNERTPLLSHPSDTSSANSLSLSSSDASNQIPDRDLPSLCNEPLLDEEARLESRSEAPLTVIPTSVGHIVSVLLIGTFVSNADSSLLFATHAIIASEFNALHDSSWLLTSFALAQAATLPLYGKLSDIYGRKPLLILAYLLFATGCFLVGVAGSMSELLIGRVISGLGASGMTALVSILITDLVPLRDVATWRSWVNIVATTGRSIGGPLGGWLADSVGWRWSFLGQVPFAGVAIVLVWIVLPARVHQLEEEKQGSKFSRIDFLGALFMTLSVLCLLLPMEIGGDRIPWSDHRIFMLFTAALVFGVLFLIAEGWVAKEPIIPLSVLRHKEVLLASLIMTCQVGAQVALMFAVPLYFQVTARASSTIAGAHLFPAVFGNAIGGLISGVVIKRTGRYKALTLGATGIASLAYLLLILRWHGNTNWLESLYIFPGGFGTGIVNSTLFISIQAALDPSFAAIAASTLYLASSIGMLAGMAGVSAVLQQSLRVNLDTRLTDLGVSGQKKWKIIEKAVADVHYIDRTKPLIANAIVGSYIEALTWTHVVSLACALTGFIATLFLRQRKLPVIFAVCTKSSPAYLPAAGSTQSQFKRLAWRCNVHVMLTSRVTHNKIQIPFKSTSLSTLESMAPLTQTEVQQLADSIQKDISTTHYACSSLDRITGGSASFTFRGVLRSPLALPIERETVSVIVKKATDFAAINSNFTLDARRSVRLPGDRVSTVCSPTHCNQAYEDAMLKALSNKELADQKDILTVCTPLSLHYFPSSQIQIIEDLQPAVDLETILKDSTDSLIQVDFATIGFALGSWLLAFHTWAKKTDQDELTLMMSRNKASQDLKWRTTYDGIVGIAQGFPIVPEEDLSVLRQVRETAQWDVLLNVIPKPQLHIIDFEFAHLGNRATDLGQMIGDLLEKSYMFESGSGTYLNCELIIGSFVKGYGSISQHMAKRVMIHAGVHLINWCARHPGAEMRGKGEGLMQRAIEIIKTAWNEDEAFFHGGLLRLQAVPSQQQNLASSTKVSPYFLSPQSVVKADIVFYETVKPLYDRSLYTDKNEQSHRIGQYSSQPTGCCFYSQPCNSERRATEPGDNITCDICLLARFRVLLTGFYTCGNDTTAGQHFNGARFSPCPLCAMVQQGSQTICNTERNTYQPSSQVIDNQLSLRLSSIAAMAFMGIVAGVPNSRVPLILPPSRQLPRAILGKAITVSFLVALKKPEQAFMAPQPARAIRYAGSPNPCTQCCNNRAGTEFRYAPNSVCLNTPKAYRHIFGPKGNVKKNVFYEIWPATPDHVNTWSANSISVHARKRRVLNYAFSESALRGAEVFVHANVDRWLELLGQKKLNDSQWTVPIDMADQVTYLVFDILGDLCFGKCFDMKEASNPPTLQLFTDMAKLAWSPIGSLFIWLKPRGIDRLIAATTPAVVQNWHGFVQDCLKKRTAKQLELKQKPIPESEVRKDFFHWLFGAKDPETGTEYSTSELHAECELLIIAGSDTTSIVLSAAYFYLSRNPRIQERLAQEIQSTFASYDDIKAGPKLQSCTFLTAFLMEAMRMAPPVAAEPGREVLPGGTTVNGHYFPQGTQVSTAFWAMHYNEDYYPEALQFRPERWIEGEAGSTVESVALAESAFCAFSAGSRGCVGKNMAWMEMRIVISKTLWKFEIKQDPENKLGGGSAGAGPGRCEEGQYQTYEMFVSNRKGPVVQLKERLH